MEPPWGNQLYITLSLKNAKRMAWPTIKKLNKEFDLGGQVNDAEGMIRFPNLPNEPIIYLGGCKDSAEIEKIRGYEGGLKRVIIDEAQAIRKSLFGPLIEEIVEPALLDYNGELDVVGTPGAVKAGYFHDIDVGDKSASWEHFFWDAYANTFLAEKRGQATDEMLEQVRREHNWQEDSPRYVREYLGQWVTDTDSLALHYDAERNRCDWQNEPVPGWTYLLTFDIGFEDADAIAVLGYPPNARKLHLVRELITRKQGITELGTQLKTLYETYHPLQVIGDLGALGKKIGHELEARWHLPVEAAEKSRKAEHIELLDDGLRTGAMLAPPDSVFAQDCAIVQWDADQKAKGNLVFDASFHSDVVDACLYGYRAAFHWTVDDSAQPDVPIEVAQHREAVRAELREVRQQEDDAYERNMGWG
jgi:hypothetical protein